MISQTAKFPAIKTAWPHEPRAAENDVTVAVTAVITPTSSGLPVFEMIDPATNLEEDDTAEILRNRLRGLVHQLELCWSDDRVILTGVCPSYHAKQLVSSMTQQLVTDRHICNQICVER
ncbi:hypothetical protein [Planctopirus hydrillae]|uniref:Uncharacterized protein n=1 Tax=Planctopirus hydrillae TaxID=1841610 RepID=A0A1C3E7R9_9PLAN|nr:hypothetical protein [Planctopirus hydrillae]ODA29290.1 hypothetical protein A6X21_09335 [Planctopirus hydrillae]